jgi:hypothetical protein
MTCRKQKELRRLQQQLDERLRRADESSQHLNKRRRLAGESSGRRVNLSSIGGATGVTGARQNRSRSRLSQVPPGMRNIIRDLDLPFMSVDSSGNMIPKIAETAIVAAQTYMMVT